MNHENNVCYKKEIIMKRLLPCLTLILAAQAYAVSPATMMSSSPNYLPNYEQILSAVTQGQDIRIGFAFEKCTNETNTPVKSAFQLGIYTPNEVIVANSGSILASMNHFTLNDNQAKGQAAYQFARYKITTDNNIILSMQVLNAVTMQPVGVKQTYTCALGTGAFVVAK
jgi:hypothetical protein